MKDHRLIIIFLKITIIIIIALIIEWFTYDILLPAWIAGGENPTIALEAAQSITTFFWSISFGAIIIILYFKLMIEDWD